MSSSANTPQSPRLVAFEHTRTHPSTNSSVQNTLLFVGGLSDGLLTVPYVARLAQVLPPSYALIEVLLSSSYSGWGTSSLDKDCAEISECITYLRNKRPSGKMVVMGHSTGCQDAIHYLTGGKAESRPPIDGVIIQASVSDREATVELLAGIIDESVRVAQELVKAGRGEELLPFSVTGHFLHTPICARRWLSLASPDKKGEDDLFSSDLEDDQLRRTFGSLPARSPLCILYSGNDEYVPKFVDREALVKKWMGIVRRGGGVVDDEYSGLIKGATHSLRGNPDEVVQDLLRRVVGFLDALETGKMDGKKSGSNEQSSL